MKIGAVATFEGGIYPGFAWREWFWPTDERLEARTTIAAVFGE